MARQTYMFGCIQYSFLCVSEHLPSVNEKSLDFIKLDYLL